MTKNFYVEDKRYLPCGLFRQRDGGEFLFHHEHTLGAGECERLTLEAFDQELYIYIYNGTRGGDIDKLTEEELHGLRENLLRQCKEKAGIVVESDYKTVEDSVVSTITNEPQFTLPPDPDEKNDDRAAWAEVALDAFMVQTLQADQKEALTSLVCDRLHLADRLDMDPEQVLRRAKDYYEAETEEETMLSKLCKETGTTEDDWEDMDGLETGVGVESWFRHVSDGREAYCVEDQGEITVSVSEGSGDEEE